MAQVDEHLAVLDMRPVGLQVRKTGRLHRLAARHVEGAEVHTALDDVPFQEAISEIGEGMGAAAFGGIKAAVNIVDRHELVAELERFDGARRDIRSRAHRNRVFCHDVTECGVALVL
jgi:hypothetical protein